MTNYPVRGNLGQKPELRFAPSGTPYTFFMIAENTHKKDNPKNQTVWWDCVAFKELAEDITRKYDKGDSIEVAKGSFVPKRGQQGKVQLQIWELGKPADLPQGDDVPPASDGDDEIPF